MHIWLVCAFENDHKFVAPFSLRLRISYVRILRMRYKLKQIVWYGSSESASFTMCCNNQLDVVNGPYTNGALSMLCPHFKWNLHGVRRLAMQHNAIFNWNLSTVASERQLLLFVTAHSCLVHASSVIYFRLFLVCKCSSNATASTFNSLFHHCH